MAMIIVNNDNSPVLLCVSIKNNQYGTTTITLDEKLVKTIGGSFTGFEIGTNLGLRNHTVSVTTNVLVTNTITTTEVDFDLTGASQPDHYTSQKQALPGNAYVTHFNEYIFI